MSEEPQASTPLPDSLRQQLEEFRRRLWRTKIAEAVLAGIFGLLLSYLLVFALDRVWTTPAMIRLGILLGGTSLAAVFAPIWLHRWVWKHRRENQLARLISRKHPGLGDRLLGVIELQGQSEGLDSLSPRLRAAAMEAVAAETARRKLDDSLPVSRHQRWTLAVIALFLLSACALTLVPQAGMNSLKRWLFPLSSTPRYTFTVVEDLPLELPVPQGEAFSLNVRLADDSAWTPANATARLGRQDPVSADLSDRDYRFEFPGQQEPGRLKLEIGDARHTIRIVPALRPVVERSFAEIEYPDYLQLEGETLELPTGTLTAVQGSTVRLGIESSRELRRAAYGPAAASDAAGLADAEDEPAPADPSPEPMAVKLDSAITGPIPVDEADLEIPMSWEDSLGLAGSEGFKLRIQSVADEAPTCYMEGVPTRRALLPEETLDFEVIASDDFGIREYGLEWSGEPTRPGASEGDKGDLVLQKGDARLRSSSTPASFSPKAYDIGPQKLTLRAYVGDFLPDRGRVYSQPVILYILTREEHAQMLKNRFDRAISELEDLTRRERGLYEENQRLERLDGEELRDGEAAERLERQEEAERQQSEKMKELSEKMEELMKDSTRNETIGKETLRRLAETMKAMRELGEQDMPEVQGKLGEAGDPKNTEEKSEQEMDEAVEKQRQTLEKMEETIEKANDANQRFEASTFVARFKKAASDEEGIAKAAIDQSEHLGLRPEQMDPALLTRLDEIIRQQSDTTSEVRWLEEDLGHFFTRTAKEVYGEILDEMIESEIDLGLEDVRARLGRNHGFIAAQSATLWAEKLKEWADKLEGAAQDEGGGGGGAGGGGSAEDEDFEFMLRVMRMVQKEQDLRARTRALETLRRSYEMEDTP